LDFHCQDCILAQIFFSLQQISRTLVAFLFFTTERFLLSFLIFTVVVTGYRSQPRVCFCGAGSLLGSSPRAGDRLQVLQALPCLCFLLAKPSHFSHHQLTVPYCVDRTKFW
jgi:hypothetical protein